MGDLGGLARLTGGPGWAAFTDPARYVDAVLVLALATLSGVVLAHHPVYRGRMLTRDDLEQRKTLVIYSSVGALIAIICTAAPPMAFVIFGIGGLMRFRTNTGESKVTGHTIMATLIGLCWGLGLPLVAALATAYMLVLIYAFEGAPVHEVTVTGLQTAQLDRALEAYRAAFVKHEHRVLGVDKSSKKARVRLVVRTRRGLSTDEIAALLESVPAELRGSCDISD